MAEAAEQCVREIQIDDGTVLTVAEQHALDNDSGSVVWDAALVLAHFLIKQQQLGNISFSGKRVIELGSGTGVVGLTAAALGAAEVLLTDRPHLLAHLELNIQRNKLSDVASAAALEWGQPLPPGVAPPFDLLLCSDLVYGAAAVQPLLQSMRSLIGPRSAIYAACEFRAGAGLELMHNLLPQHGLVAQLVPFTLLDEEWRSPDILVWQILPQPTDEPPPQQQQQQEVAAVGAAAEGTTVDATTASAVDATADAPGGETAAGLISHEL